jgi:hypothetical protein
MAVECDEMALSDIHTTHQNYFLELKDRIYLQQCMLLITMVMFVSMKKGLPGRRIYTCRKGCNFYFHMVKNWGEKKTFYNDEYNQNEVDIAKRTVAFKIMLIYENFFLKMCL